MNRTIIRYLQRHGANTIFLANRCLDKAKAMASELGCYALGLSSLPELLEQTDILISASSAPHYVLGPENWRGSHKMLLIDLAVPRDIDPKLGEYPNIDLLNIEEFEAIVSTEQNNRLRQKELAKEIIEQEVLKFSQDEVRRNGI